MTQRTLSPEQITYEETLLELSKSLQKAKNLYDAKKKEFAKNIVASQPILFASVQTVKALFDNPISTKPSDALKPYELQYYKALQDYTKYKHKPIVSMTLEIKQCKQ
jgi:hypothetical protein